MGLEAQNETNRINWCNKTPSNAFSDSTNISDS